MIENDNLFLTKINQQDRDFYCGIYTNEGLLKYIVAPLSIEEAKKSFTITLKKMLINPPKLKLYIINSKQYKEKLGIIGIKWNQVNKKHVEFGVIIVKKHQRQGVAFMAINLLIQHIFEKLKANKIIAICHAANSAANHSFKKIGFVQRNSKEENKTIWEKIIK